MPEADPQPRRSAGRWVLLLIVWAVGLAVWALYLIAILYVFFRLLGAFG